MINFIVFRKFYFYFIQLRFLIQSFNFIIYHILLLIVNFLFINFLILFLIMKFHLDNPIFHLQFFLIYHKLHLVIIKDL